MSTATQVGGSPPAQSPRRHLPAHVRPGGGPLGALPRLSSAARRALACCTALAALGAAALIAQGWALSSVLAEAVAGRGGDVGPRLVVLVAVVVFRALVGWATQVVAARAAAGAKEELRARLLDSALARGPEWIAQREPAALTVLATKGLDALDAYFTTYLPALIAAVVVPPAIGAGILFADWPAAVVIATTVPLIPVFAVLIGRYTQGRVAAAADATTRLSVHLLEMTRALPVLAAFRRAEAQADAVRRVSDRHRKAVGATLRTAFASALVLELIGTLSVALVAVIIGIRLVSGDMTLATGLFVLILVPECYFPLRAAGAAHHASEDGVEAVRRIAEMITPPVGPQDTSPGDRRQDADRPLVSVHGLTVRRRDGNAPDGLSFTIRPGEVTRLDAPSGAGKSTAISVLLGFAAPTSGTVLVDGRDLSAVDIEEWRRSVAWVPQRPAFTGGTVADELAIAASDSADPPPSRAELESVAADAGADHLLDRAVTELSTGERQRVAVARALLRVRRGATLLLLDEPTAHLDPVTAGRVMTAVHAAAADGVGVLLVTHRTADPRRERSEEDTVVSGTSSPAVGPAGAAGRLSELLSARLVGGAALGALSLVCGIALTATSAWLIATAAGRPPLLSLSVAVVGVRTFGLARAVLRYLERLVSHDAAFRRAGRLRVRLWHGLVSLGPARTIALRRGEGAQRLVDDVDAVRDLVPRVLTPPIMGGIACVAAVLAQTVILPAAGLVLAVAALLAGVGAPLLALALDRRATSALAAGRRRVAAEVLGLFDAAPELLAFGAHRRKRAALAEADARLAAQSRRQAFGEGAATGLITLLTGLAAVAGAALAVSAVPAGTLAPALAPVLALVPLALVEPLTPLPAALKQRDPLRAAHARVRALTDATSCRMGAKSNAGRANGDTCDTNNAGIRLAGVDVRWPGAAEPSLRDVTLDIPAGTHVVVTGPSGAGKSTLLALLLGFLEPECGAALLPRRVAWCPQEPQLVSTTIRENLRLGDGEATTSRQQDALRMASLAHWESRLDSRIGVGGSALSGGEAQRLALARALLAAPDADLVLLDEPTAHLDRPTAEAVLTGLRSALAGRTVVHVTHHAEEEAGADLVIEIVHGEVRARGRAT